MHGINIIICVKVYDNGINRSVLFAYSGNLLYRYVCCVPPSKKNRNKLFFDF